MTIESVQTALNVIESARHRISATPSEHEAIIKALKELVELANAHFKVEEKKEVKSEV